MENISELTSQEINERKLQKQKRANIKRRARDKILKDNGEKPYQCNQCPSKYANSGTLHRHKQTHADRPNFKCDICEKWFQTDLTLYTHKISHLERTIKCELCPLMFQSKARLTSHEKVHTGEKKYRCETCDKTFTQGASLKRHKLQHEERKEKCSTCGKKFHDKYDMMKHEKTHATSVVMFIPYETPCNICSMTFASIAKIKQHNEYHHPDSKITYKKPKMVFACTNCDKILKDGYQLKLHLSRHDKKENDMTEKKKEEEIKIVNTCCSYEGKAPHRCDQCQKCFTRSKFLLKHMRQSSKHGAKRPILKRDKICNICEAQFHSHSTLKQHQITHTGEKLFACPTCDKKFSQSGTLLRHKRSHTGEKNHQCLECGKWFQEKGYLKLHKITHSAEKPHACNSCDQSFTQSHNLKAHKKSHVERVSFTCKLCQKLFQGLASLRTHEKNPHWRNAIQLFAM